jgi:elongation factor 2 kinase
MPLNVAFVPSFALEVHETQTFLAVEPVLCGDFAKHNNNDGVIFGRRNTPQAFSHFTWEESNRAILVCEIQGVGFLPTAIRVL